MGRVATKKLHGSSTNQLTYAYNIRSWLTGITGGKFTQTLGYGNHYNGNTSTMNWTANGTSHAYTFSYDGVNRMLNATHGTGAYTEKVTGYDKNGNINGLQRYDNSSLVDNLSYTYNGNQLAKVEDATGNASGFVNGVSTTNEYIYDANGNLTKDSNKDIASITYNCLNLPQVVTFSNGSTITYLYTADGRKLRTIHVINGTTTTTDYSGNVIYENGGQKLLLTEEGYVDLANSNTYYYYLKDHQGNNRVAVSSSGTVMETNHYYPFGGVFSTSSNVQPYKYNGKELDSKNGLNWYDYGARHYDSALGRWHVVDPLAEKYYSTSPYAYCRNNPVLLKDPTGKEGIKYTDENGNKIIESNIVILLEAKKVIPENATDKQISKINKQNNRIEKRNAAKIVSAQNKLNEIYNGADGKGSKNNNGEFVRFKFNVIGKETNDLSGGNSLGQIAREYGLRAKQFGSETIARAVVVSKGSTNGALGLHSANSITIAENAPSITLPHEVGHSLGLPDNYPESKGSLMDYPPTNVLVPDDVDMIWNKAKNKY